MFVAALTAMVSDSTVTTTHLLSVQGDRQATDFPGAVSPVPQDPGDDTQLDQGGGQG